MKHHVIFLQPIVPDAFCSFQTNIHTDQHPHTYSNPIHTSIFHRCIHTVHTNPLEYVLNPYIRAMNLRPRFDVAYIYWHAKKQEENLIPSLCSLGTYPVCYSRLLFRRMGLIDKYSVYTPLISNNVIEMVLFLFLLIV
jgi:hypothetical protein